MPMGDVRGREKQWGEKTSAILCCLNCITCMPIKQQERCSLERTQLDTHTSRVFFLYRSVKLVELPSTWTVHTWHKDAKACQNILLQTISITSFPAACYSGISEPFHTHSQARICYTGCSTEQYMLHSPITHKHMHVLCKHYNLYLGHTHISPCSFVCALFHSFPPHLYIHGWMSIHDEYYAPQEVS